jgi:hypothetical protein
MEQENKYYTPEAEEFCVGFEFEYLENKTWVKKILPFYNNYASLWGSNPDAKLFRVKYLDKEDVESLGWEFRQSEVGFFELNRFQLFFFGDQFISIDKEVISHSNNYTATYQHFRGIIKNKSELKKLMVQLSI